MVVESIPVNVATVNPPINYDRDAQRASVVMAAIPSSAEAAIRTLIRVDRLPRRPFIGAPSPEVKSIYPRFAADGDCSSFLKCLPHSRHTLTKSRRTPRFLGPTMMPAITREIGSQ